MVNEVAYSYYKNNVVHSIGFIDVLVPIAHKKYLPVSEDFPIFEKIYHRISLYILYISLNQISNLPTKIHEIPSLFNHSPYLERENLLALDVLQVCLSVVGLGGNIKFQIVKVIENRTPERVKPMSTAY